MGVPFTINIWMQYSDQLEIATVVHLHCASRSAAQVALARYDKLI